MRYSHFFSIFLISWLSRSFVKFSCGLYPSYEDCSPNSICNNSVIHYPFQTYGTDPCNKASDAPNVVCPDKNTTIFCGYPYTCDSTTTCYGDIQNSCVTRGQYRILGGLTQLSYTTRTIRIADDALFGDCSLPLADPYHTLPFIDNSGFDHKSETYNLSDKYMEQFLPVTYKPRTLPVSGQSSAWIANNQTLLASFSLVDCLYHFKQVVAHTQFAFLLTKTTTSVLKRIFDSSYKEDLKSHGRSAKLAFQASGGRCYGEFGSYLSELGACICPQDVHRYNCSDGYPIKNKKQPRIPSKTIAEICGLVFGISAMATVLIVVVYRWINKKRRELREEEQDIRAYMDPLDSRPASVENFLHEGMPSRYSYAQIKRYTNNFAEKLGQGGFGTVFKGKLPNEHLVAIKILDKSKHNRKQFMNEVATLGRIHHIHLVRLLGYCFQGSKRALVYDYMLNGSLEKYIHGDDKNALDWKQLHTIAMGTARGISYLHEDCASRILHFDIKPHNVLLDANFCPKVADFGLAKLADREGSHISLTAAMGTPGYAAPEVWSKNLGPVTDRSDVYSYGMLVMEMVGGRKNFDMQASRESKLYYPEWAFKRVENGEFGKLREKDIGGEEEESIAKMLSLVGLWCIQYNPYHRPAMSKVIKMLEGSIELSIPPLPFPVDTSLPITSLTDSSSSIPFPVDTSLPITSLTDSSSSM